MDRHEERISKLALCVSSCMVAKDGLVESEGIGEDLPFTVFGWRNDFLIVVAQLDSGLMKLEPNDRLQRVSFCCNIFRMGWGVDAITFMAEAFCSTEPEKTKGYALDVLYAEQEQAVKECLTFTHIDGESASLVMVPYKLKLGRKVEWGEAVHQRQADGLRDSQYPAAIAHALEQPIRERPEGEVEFFDSLVQGLAEKGFSVDCLI